MKVLTKTIHVKTKGQDDMIDITKNISEVISSSQIKQGIVTTFVIGSTAAITTIEYESGLRKDFPRICLKELLRPILNMIIKNVA
jgi:thiamine phosphate synthase YjbQ (UPF0047 family)